MVNSNAVNAKTRVFRRRVSANLSAFPVEFYVSRIPLNMRAFSILTIKRCIPPPRLPKFPFNINVQSFVKAHCLQLRLKGKGRIFAKSAGPAQRTRLTMRYTGSGYGLREDPAANRQAPRQVLSHAGLLHQRVAKLVAELALEQLACGGVRQRL